MKLDLLTNATVINDAIKFVSDKSSSYIEPELEKHKVDDVVTVDKKHSGKNDIQGSEEEDSKQQSTTNTEANIESLSTKLERQIQWRRNKVAELDSKGHS